MLRATPFLAEAVRRLAGLGIEVSLFVEPDAAQINRTRELGAQGIELHTGTYADATPEARPALALKLAEAARHAATLGLECHAGHGLSYETITPIAAIAEISEVSIGHFLISASVFEGMPGAIARMRGLMVAARG